MSNVISELLSTPNLKKEWQKRRERMLADKIDYAKFLTWFIENYPESHAIAKEANDEFWKQFK